LPLPVHVPVPAPVQQGPGSPAAAHCAFVVSSPGSSRKLWLASSFAPLIPVIRPAVTPPVPRFTFTRQVPTGICESAGRPLVSTRTAARWIASEGLRESLTSGSTAPRPSDHWPE